MRWTLTIKDQTYGTGVEIPKYACRVTRAGGIVRLTVENQGPRWTPENRPVVDGAKPASGRAP
jgi:hypothetical protein